MHRRTLLGLRAKCWPSGMEILEASRDLPRTSQLVKVSLPCSPSVEIGERRRTSHALLWCKRQREMAWYMH